MMNISTRSLFFTPFLALAFAVPSVTFANDTAAAGIEVESIETNAKVNTEMSFKGEEARKILQILPKVESAAGKEFSSHFGTLVIKSPGYQIMLRCAEAEFDGTRPDLSKPVTPNCDIRFSKRVDEEPNFPFNPGKQCK
jgi:hypothetical protein